MNHALEIYISDNVSILLMESFSINDNTNKKYGVIKNQNNKNVIVKDNLDKRTAKNLFNKIKAAL